MIIDNCAIAVVSLAFYRQSGIISSFPPRRTKGEAGRGSEWKDWTALRQPGVL